MMQEISHLREQIAQAQAEERATFTVLDDYKTELCCLDKPELVQATRCVGIKKYSQRTRSNLMIGHLMTMRRRELGYEDLLDRIDAMQAQLILLREQEAA